MFILYYKPSCAFSQRVIQMAENLNVSLVLKDVSESEEAMNTLMELSGKSQTPFLVDDTNNTMLDDSNDIIDHLREYGKVASPLTVMKPRVHVGGSVCESCEG